VSAFDARGCSGNRHGAILGHSQQQACRVAQTSVDTRSARFALRRRNPRGGRAPLADWGFRNETDPLTDVLLVPVCVLSQTVLPSR